MNLEECISLWETDGQINENDLARESLRTNDLLRRWAPHRARERLLLEDAKKDLAILKRDRREQTTAEVHLGPRMVGARKF